VDSLIIFLLIIFSVFGVAGTTVYQHNEYMACVEKLGKTSRPPEQIRQICNGDNSDSLSISVSSKPAMSASHAGAVAKVRTSPPN
jgi:hypothetical protein